MSQVLSIHKLQIRQGSFTLGPVDFSVNEAEYLTLLGPTGCGKTTLLKTIAGITGMVKGMIFIETEDVGMLSSEKRKIGYVSQANSLFPHLSVRRNIEFGLRYLDLTRTQKNERIEFYLDLFRITHLAGRMIGGLSGGECKRVMMARSLVLEPKLLLLDEPLGMLDHNAREETLSSIIHVYEKIRPTVIHVTHDRREAWSVGKRCAVMEHGVIVQDGSVDELFRTPKDRFTAEFLGGENIYPAIFEDGYAVTGFGKISVRDKNINGKGLVFIRAELIRPAKKDEIPFATGHVVSLSDRGEYIEVRVKAHSDSIVFYCPVHDRDGISFGDEIDLYCPDDAAHRLPDDRSQ
jgi:ABC-type Fe3+/spermidine/putrescine transport system ATPase subunit